MSEILKADPLGNSIFLVKMLALVSARKCASTIFREGKRSEVDSLKKRRENGGWHVLKSRTFTKNGRLHVLKI